jgi:hypothetical protein
VSRYRAGTSSRPSSWKNPSCTGARHPGSTSHDFARKVARHYTNVLAVGATGTGKELVARAIHQISPVSSQKLAVCNCSALDKANCSGTCAARLPEQRTRSPDCSNTPMAAPFFSTRSAKPRWPCRPSCCGVIQNREIQRVGSPEVKQIHVRLIAFLSEPTINQPDTPERCVIVPWQLRGARCSRRDVIRDP